FSHTRFEPSGFTNNPEIPIAKSITDYIFRWLALKFLPSEEEAGQEATPVEAAPTKRESVPEMAIAKEGEGAVAMSANSLTSLFLNQADAPPCPVCGSITV